MLTKDDCDLILGSLSFTRDKFESYQYGDENLRRERIADVERAVLGIRAIRNALPRGAA